MAEDSEEEAFGRVIDVMTADVERVEPQTRSTRPQGS
jgi:hypothetical protein